MIQYEFPKKYLKGYSFWGTLVKKFENYYKYNKWDDLGVLTVKGNAKEVNTKILGQKVAKLGHALI